MLMTDALMSAIGSSVLGPRCAASDATAKTRITAETAHRGIGAEYPTSCRSGQLIQVNRASLDRGPFLSGFDHSSRASASSASVRASSPFAVQARVGSP